VLYTDFTELRYGGGKAWLMALLDHATKLAVGWAIGASADTQLALRAWRRARRWLRRHGVPITGMIVHHDQDPVYTGYGWLTALLASAFVVNNSGFVRFLLRKRGAIFALKCLCVLFIEYIAAGTAVLISIFL